MRRPTRTRRLSIAATVSLLAFAVVAAAHVRSWWFTDVLDFGRYHYIELTGGCIIFEHLPGPMTDAMTDKAGFTSWHDRGSTDASHVLEFSVKHVVNRFSDYFIIRIPLWFPLLLLLIAPIRWLIARPANAPAFPVVTKHP